MAWIDLGDQFIALTEGGPEVPDRGRHVGLVVDDKEALRAELIAAGEDVGAQGSVRVRDPSGNLLEIVDYREVQFTKSPGILRAMGAGELVKGEAAREELRVKGGPMTDARAVGRVGAVADIPMRCGWRGAAGPGAWGRHHRSARPGSRRDR